MRRVYLVDDDRFVRNTSWTAVDRVCKKEGIKVDIIEFDDGEDAFNTLYDTPIEEIALVITDLEMPGMDGVDLRDRLREWGYNGPIVLVSGGVNRPAAEHLIKTKKFDAVGLKPYSLSLMMEIITTFLKGEQLDESKRVFAR